MCKTIQLTDISTFIIVIKVLYRLFPSPPLIGFFRSFATIFGLLRHICYSKLVLKKAVAIYDKSILKNEFCT
jgi:hypothetical protein